MCMVGFECERTIDKNLLMVFSSTINFTQVRKHALQRMDFVSMQALHIFQRAPAVIQLLFVITKPKINLWGNLENRSNSLYSYVFI